jgi:hypothetical protein
MKSPLVRHAATYGLYVGLALIVLSLLDYLLGFYGKNTAYIIFNHLVMAAGIVWATIQYRDKEKGGFISYGDSVGYGVLLSLFLGIVSSVFTIVLVTIISPDYMEHVMNITLEKLYEQGTLTDAQIEMTVKMMEKMSGPLILFISGVISSVIMGLIISLIASIFTRRNRPMFTGIEN